MKIITSGRKKLKDRHIDWKEKYGKKSFAVKKKFEKMLPGSYFRWEGFDYNETMHPYFVVVGPTDSRRYGKAFFAGNKKLPTDPKEKVYSPSGKYFSSLREALHHASDMWGTPTPKNAGHYKKVDLLPLDIPSHLKG